VLAGCRPASRLTDRCDQEEIARGRAAAAVRACGRSGLARTITFCAGGAAAVVVVVDM
jgi:hypothetical protein